MLKTVRKNGVRKSRRENGARKSRRLFFGGRTVMAKNELLLPQNERMASHIHFMAGKTR